EQLKKYGWLSLGSWYQTFATANQKVNDAAALKPVVSGISGIGEIGAGDTLSGVMTAYQAQLQNTSYTPPLGTPNIKNTQMADSDVPSAMLTNIFESPGQYLANYFATSFSGNDINEQTNPLLKMKDIGDRTLVTTETALISFTLMRSAVETYTKGVSGFFLEILSFKGSELAKNIIVTISPIVFFVLIILLGIGFSLSIYLPFIPFIYWLSGSANWVVSVLVGSTGGSLWAATHIGTEKDKGSRAAYGYIFLIDGMIRPMLMVLGFAFSSLTLIAIGTLLNILYASAIANVQSNSITGLVSLIGILMIYARLCTTTVSRVFALQVTMPDYIISWLGGREAASILGNAVDSTKEIFAGFSHGLQRTPGVKLGNANNSSKGNMDGIK
ncbi:DotA/TraY family protein, partial [Escherichia coli]|nr:DotA/TraY family protein [Escherichia coli]